MHICITHGHRQQCGKCRGEWEGAGWRGARREMGDMCNSVNNKNK